MSRYRSVLFDWDGCLARTLDVWFAGFREVSAAHGRPLTTSQIATVLGSWTGLGQFGYDAEANARFNVDLLAYADARLAGAGLYDGARALLTELSELPAVRVALVTSSARSSLEKVLGDEGIATFFDAMVTVEDVANHKPHAEPIERALELIGGDPTSAVMIGDSDKDLGAARNAGIDSILFAPPDHDEIYDAEHLASFDPTHTCRSFTDIRRVLLAG